MTNKQIGLLIGVAALGIAVYYGRRTSTQLAALAIRAQTPSPIVNPPVVGPGTDARGLAPGDENFAWQDAGLG